MKYTKGADHIFKVPHIEPKLAEALGRYVISIGRLEDAVKVVIERFKENYDISKAIEEHEKKPLGVLIKALPKNQNEEVEKVKVQLEDINTKRQDYIHATITQDPKDGSHYVRFRQGISHHDEAKDIKELKKETRKVCALIAQIKDLK